MARKSYQRGWVVPRGKKWYGYYRRTVIDPVAGQQRGEVVPVVLGLKSELTKFKAREALEQEINRQTRRSGARLMMDAAVSLQWFVRSRFFPMREGSTWRDETAKVKKLLIERDILAQFGEVPLKEIDRFMLQTHLNSLAGKVSRDRVLHARYYLKAIFREAVDQDFLLKDPAASLVTPKQLRGVDRTVLTWEQLRMVLAKASRRDRVLLQVEMTHALRPSELFALRWRSLDFDAGTLTVEETAYKGKLRPWGKTRRALGTLPLAAGLAEELWLWKQECADQGPDAFVFPAARRGGRRGFIATDNYRKRVLQKLAGELGLPKLNFQILRRTVATLAQVKGGIKDVQGLLRHATADTTANVYMQEIPGGVKRTVESIYEELKAGGAVAAAG